MSEVKRFETQPHTQPAASNKDALATVPSCGTPHTHTHMREGTGMRSTETPMMTE